MTEHRTSPDTSAEPDLEELLEDEEAQRGPSPNVLAAAGAAVVAALTAWILWRLRLRRQPDTPVERLTAAGKSLGSASAAYTGRTASRIRSTAGPAAERIRDSAVPAAERIKESAVPAAERLLESAAPAAERSGELAQQGLKLGKAGAAALASRTSDVGSVVAETSKQAGSGLADAAGAVAETAHDVHRFWAKWTHRIFLLLCGAIGYTLGARAGRERYEQIAGAAQAVAGRPEVQQAKEKVTHRQG